MKSRCPSSRALKLRQQKENKSKKMLEKLRLQRERQKGQPIKLLRVIESDSVEKWCWENPSSCLHTHLPLPLPHTLTRTYTGVSNESDAINSDTVLSDEEDKAPRGATEEDWGVDNGCPPWPSPTRELTHILFPDSESSGEESDWIVSDSEDITTMSVGLEVCTCVCECGGSSIRSNQSE